MTAHTHPVGPGRPFAVSLPRTPLLARALPSVDWTDAFAVATPMEAHGRHPQEWADAILGSPPAWLRILFGVRELLVRSIGIERGGRHVFDTVSCRPTEVLLGTDQKHLAFRVSVLVESGVVVLSTVVDVRSRRGRAYSALVRRIHPLVVRALLVRAARRMSAPGGVGVIAGSPAGLAITGSSPGSGRAGLGARSSSSHPISNSYVNGYAPVTP